jgi:hypothetical protein
MARAKKDGVEKAIIRGNDTEVVLDKVAEEIVEMIEAGKDAAIRGAGGATRKDRDTVYGLHDDLGVGLWVPRQFRPHLVAARRSAKEKLADKHGVSFRRVGDDCLVEATNGVASISILLEGEGERAPAVRTVIPARAMKLISAAAAEEIDLAEVWFRGTRVIVRVGDEYHTFRVIQPDLPFPGENLLAAKTGPSVYDLCIDATLLLQVQKALGAPTVGIHRAGKGHVAIFPEGEVTSLAVGFLATCGDMEG